MGLGGGKILGALGMVVLSPLLFAQEHQQGFDVSERSLSSKTIYATYDKVPLLEGHGSFFDANVTLQDPVTKTEFEHQNATLEIINKSTASSVLECANLSVAWSGDENLIKANPPVCGVQEFLVKVWPTAKNQSRESSCFCVLKDVYRSSGKSPRDLKAFAKPNPGKNLSLIPLTKDVQAVRPDGSHVEYNRLEGVFAEDLGPGPVDTKNGFRFRYMRFYKKNAKGFFEPLRSDQDLIYQVVDSGMVPTDIPAMSLAKHQMLRRTDGSRVAVDRVSSDMWLRPRYIDPETGDRFLGSIVHNEGGVQKNLNDHLYSIPSESMDKNFGLMSRMRSPENWNSFEIAKLGAEISSKQVIKEDVSLTKPPVSDSINKALPVIEQYSDASKRLGYYTHTYDDGFVWGRSHIIWNVQEAARRLKARGITMGIGDINRRPNPGRIKGDRHNYAFTPNHRSHNTGRAVDMRMITHNGMAQRMNLALKHDREKLFDREKTFEMIKTLIDVDPNIETIFIADNQLLAMIRQYLAKKGIKPLSVAAKGHFNHIHISWKN